MTNATFTDGQVLFSANLKSAFANTVNVAGDTMTGPLVVPSITTSLVSNLDGGINSTGILNLTNPSLNLKGLNVYNTLVASFQQANIATTLAQSAFDSGNTTLTVAQAAFNAANSINVSGGGSTSQQTFLTSNGIIANGGVSLTVFGNNTVILSANGATTTQVGVVQLNDTVSSASLTQAATANSVKTTWTLANNTAANIAAVNTYAGSGYGIANSALNLSQSAFAAANASSGTGKVSKTGDIVTGEITITSPNIGLTVSNNATVNGTFAIAGVDIGTGLVQAQTTANSGLNLASSAYGRANAAIQNQLTLRSANGLTVNTGTSLTVTGNATVFISANIGNTTQAGIVQLNDTVTSTSVSLAATANAINTVWTTAIAAFAKANTNTGGSGGGTGQLTFISSNGITTNAATSLTVVGNNTVLLSANIANTTQPGIVQLNDTVFGTFTTQAATANAVTTAFNTATGAFAKANLNYNFGNAIVAANLTVTGGTSLVINSNTILIVSANLGNTTQLGVVQLNDTVTSTSTTLAATANAINTVWTTAQAAFAKANTGSGAGGSTSQQTFLTSNGLTVNATTNFTVFGNNTVLLSANLGNTTQAGIVQLNDTLTSTSTTVATTANISNTIWNFVKAAFIRANVAETNQTIFNTTNGLAANGGSTATITGNNTIALTANNASTTTVGVVQLNDTVISTSTTTAATPNSVNTVWTTAVAAFTKANLASGLVKTGDYMTGTLTVPTLTSNTSIITGTVTANTSMATGTLTATGNVVAANLVTSGAVNSSVILVNPIVAGTNYILTMKDSGTVITFANANTTLVNVNNNLVVGFRAILTQIGTGAVKIQAGAGVTLNPRIGSNNTTISQFSSASIFCYATNTFIIDGSIS